MEFNLKQQLYLMFINLFYLQSVQLPFDLISDP